MIHRAILGSLERMLGILVEHTAGNWPFWLSPRQVLVGTVAERHEGYARKVADALRFAPLNAASEAPAGAPVRPPRELAASSSADTGLWTEVDASTRTIPKKVREGIVDGWNVVAVVGDAEEKDGAVALRFRDRETYARFVRVWGEVDAAAALAHEEGERQKLTAKGGTAAGGVAPSAAAVAKSAAAKSKSGPGVDKDKDEGGAGYYTSPLVVVPVGRARDVFVRMVQRRL
jgi:threonyl-tRNA synthetase